MPSRLATLDNLQDSSTKSKALASSYLLKSIAGRLRYCYELATGAPVTADEPRAIGLNPSGDFGCNASGPPWGAAFIACHGGRGGITPDTTYFLGQRDILPLVKVRTSDTTTTHELALRFWMQPYDDAAVGAVAAFAPLSRIYPILRLRTLSAGAQDVTIALRSHTGYERSATISIAGTTEQIVNCYEGFAGGTSIFLDTEPGRVTRGRLLLTTASTVGVALSGITYSVVIRR